MLSGEIGYPLARQHIQGAQQDIPGIPRLDDILDGHAVLFPYAFCNNKNAPVIGLSLFRCVLFPALSKEPQRHCCQAKIVAIIA